MHVKIISNRRGRVALGRGDSLARHRVGEADPEDVTIEGATSGSCQVRQVDGFEGVGAKFIVGEGGRAEAEGDGGYGSGTGSATSRRLPSPLENNVENGRRQEEEGRGRTPLKRGGGGVDLMGGRRSC